MLNIHLCENLHTDVLVRQNVYS